jgi:hypothetical protein
VALHHNAAYGSAQRAMLCALKADYDSAFNLITLDDDVVILDRGCSIALTPDLSDFIDGAVQNHQISGKGSGLHSLGIGEVNWIFMDNDNKPVTMKLTCLHVPNIPCRLLPPQQIAQQGNSKLPKVHGLARTPAQRFSMTGMS